jgi:hypothetical protein
MNPARTWLALVEITDEGETSADGQHRFHSKFEIADGIQIDGAPGVTTKVRLFETREVGYDPT